MEFGRGIGFFPGVEQWFELINRKGEEMGVNVEHYIISSGLKELIEGTSIAKYFKQIYACSFMYENDKAVWPAVAVDFTSKTQFIFMINKGIYDIWRNAQINDSMPDEGRPVPFHNMIYFGDGETDIITTGATLCSMIDTIQEAVPDIRVSVFTLGLAT